MAEKFNDSFFGDGVENVAPLVNVNWGKTDLFIEFQIKQPDGPPIDCKILPPKYFISIFGKSKRQREVKSIGMNPLKLLLACAFKTFSAGDRVILPVLLECEDDRTISSGDMKEMWLQGCLSGFHS